MKFNTPTLLTLLAVATVLLTIFGDDSFARLQSFRQSVERQRDINAHLSEQVQSAKREVNGLQNDSRALEKAARNELGMTRSDEIMVIFNDPQDDKEGRSEAK